MPKSSRHKSRRSSKCAGVNCPSNKICNPKTGRCVLKSGAIGKALLKKRSSPKKASRQSRRVSRLKSSPKRGSGKCTGVNCPSNKICNPKTGKCVLKNGVIGKKLIKHSSRKKSSRRKSRRVSRRKSSRRKSSPKKASEKCANVICTADKVCNPKTGKCVLKNGSIGKIIMQKKPDKPGRKVSVPKGDKSSKIIVPDNFVKLAEDCKKNDEWITKELLGEGQYGQAYAACKADNDKECNYVLKVQTDNRDFNLEVSALTDLQGWEYAPKMYAAWKCKGKGYFVLEKLHKCKNPRKLWSKVSKMLKQLHERDWVHVDTHSGNMMCRKDDKPVLIDYGWAGKFPGKKGKSANIALAKRRNQPMNFLQLAIIERLNASEYFGAPLNEVYKIKDCFRHVQTIFKDWSPSKNNDPKYKECVDLVI